MSDSVKIVECPRDAWQGLRALIPPDEKANYLRALAAAGFKHIDAVGFVSHSAVPQLADSERVLEILGAEPGAELIGIVVNRRGAERAIATGAVRTLGFPFSISPAFLLRNQHQSQQDALAALREIAALAGGAGLEVAAYVSMAFGNPYGEPWSIDLVAEACLRLMELGVRQISLADTVGVAYPERIAEVIVVALEAASGAEIGAHLHSRRETSAAKIRAAYGAGCRRFDAAIGGLGGCPFAQDEMVGNLATETLVAELRNLGAHVPPLAPLDELVEANKRIVREYGPAAS